jgi:hypothetical protein
MAGASTNLGTELCRYEAGRFQLRLHPDVARRHS